MDVKRRQPIGIELVKRGVVTQDDIRVALDYQKEHPDEKLGDIIHKLALCDEKILLYAIGDILGEKTIFLQPHDIKVKIDEYIAPDVLRRNKAVLFDVENGKAKVCFSDTVNTRAVDQIRLLLLNRGILLEKYITFSSNIEAVLDTMQGRATDNIGSPSSGGSDTTSLVDSIIRTGMEKRASDIHFEPLENKLRIRYRIDGELFEVAEISKDKQSQVIGRLKAISNMHQEKQESQDRKNNSIPRL